MSSVDARYSDESVKLRYSEDKEDQEPMEKELRVKSQVGLSSQVIQRMVGNLSNYLIAEYRETIPQSNILDIIRE